MNDRKFLNMQQPQTLVIGTLLLYLNAFFGLLSGLGGFAPMLPIAVAMAAGGFGIANEKKWGYGLGVVGAVLNFALLVILVGLSGIFGRFIISALFDGALVLLLLHPMSRDYQRIWFS